MRFTLLAVACLALALAPACGGAAGPATNPGATLNISITDAPFPSDFVDSASVVIREVRVRNQDDAGAEEEGAEDEGAGWTTVFEGAAEIDLVPLVGGASELLVSADITPGTYDQIRLIVDTGEVVLAPTASVQDGLFTFSSENENLHFPSGAQTGIKLKIDPPVVVQTALSADLVLDFDLTKSFVFNGPVSHPPGVRRVIFTPVVRTVNSSTAGSLAVDVLSDNGTPADAADDTPIEGATVRVFDDADAEVAVVLTDALGHAEVSTAPGTYRLSLEAAGHETAEVTDVNVFLANLTDAGSVALAATEAEIFGTVLSDGATPADDLDDVVIVGATVSAQLQDSLDAPVVTTTDATGAYRFDALAPGVYDLTVTAAGFADGALTDVTATAAGTPASITLVALTRNLTGIVADAGATPIENVSVTAVNAAGVTVGVASTGADGVYALSLATGTYDVTWTDPVSTATVTQTVVVVGTAPETDQVLDITL